MTFQRAMEIALRHGLGSFAHLYLEDVIITSSTFGVYLKVLEQIFKLLQNARLTLKGSKCHFARTEKKYLRLSITNKGIP